MTATETVEETTTTTTETAKPDAAATTTTTETKAVVETKAADVKYDLKLPAESPFDPALLERTAAIARERGLTNEQAQAIVDTLHQETASMSEKQLAAFNAKAADWEKAALANPTLGKTEAEREAAIQKGRNVVAKFAESRPDAGKRFSDFLDSTKMGSHPDAVEFFAWLGEKSGEGSFIVAGASTQKDEPAIIGGHASRKDWFPNTPDAQKKT